MNLVILPGAGSPSNPIYAGVYQLLKDAAKDHGYDRIDSPLLWPGHDNRGVLTLSGALEAANQKVNELDQDGQQYDLLARSFGCYVALKVSLDLQPKGLRKIILWGLPPYWLMWEMWQRDLESNRTKASEKGVAINHTLFPSLEPLECMLPKVQHETVVVAGELDPYVPPAYLHYLESAVRERRASELPQSIHFKAPVPGAVHEITPAAAEPVISAYLTALFR